MSADPACQSHSQTSADGERRWSPAQLRLFQREERRRLAGEYQQGMRLRPGYVDPFWVDSVWKAEQSEAVTISHSQDGLDSRPETNAHIRLVQAILTRVLVNLTLRSRDHDHSKLEAPEVEHFDRATARLSGCTYGSSEYKAFLSELQPALDHHYAVNSHHPEHYADGIRGMSLLDLVEMLADWLAACHRHADGDVRRSVEINQERFGYSDELKAIFLNTLPLIE